MKHAMPTNPKSASTSKTGSGSAAATCSGGVIDIAEQLETLIKPLEGSTQGEAVKFVLKLLSEQPALSSRIRRLEKNLEGWRSVAGHYCTCLGKAQPCKPCRLETEFRELMRQPNVTDQTPAALDSANTTDSSSRLSASVLFALLLGGGWFGVAVADEPQKILGGLDRLQLLRPNVAVTSEGSWVMANQGIPKRLHPRPVPWENDAALIVDAAVNNGVVALLHDGDGLGFMVKPLSESQEYGSESIPGIPAGLQEPAEQAQSEPEQRANEAGGEIVEGDGGEHDSSSVVWSALLGALLSVPVCILLALGCGDLWDRFNYWLLCRNAYRMARDSKANVKLCHAAESERGAQKEQSK